MVERALRASGIDFEIAIEIITTSGDEKSGRRPDPVDRHAGRKGMFTAEIERALFERRIDVAVHSAKDLPSEATAGLEVCAALPRADVEDVFISKTSDDLRALPLHATVATGSVRRQHQLRALRPDLSIPDLRGNVPTRLRKLTTNAWDGIILARAGLERLGFAVERGELLFEGHTLRSAILSADDFTPAGGQGIVALQVRSDDEHARASVQRINDGESLRCLRAEREFLRLLQGDCGTPVGVLARISDGRMEVRAQLFDEGRAEARTAALQSDGTDDEPEALAAKLLELINGG
jgi:hydroxymethylbilane synthase